MTNANAQIADAIREVTAAVQTAIASGHRSMTIEVDPVIWTTGLDGKRLSIL